jgi:hypothetical protein
MGALDDAIREHLELKRRHGASDEEIRQAEAEALGPARREPGAESFVDEAGMSAPPAPVAFDESFHHEPLHEVPYEPPPLQSDAVEDAPPPPPPPESVPLDPTALRALPSEPAAVEPTPIAPVPVDETPVEEAPVDEVPVEEPPVEEAPVEAPEPGTPKPHGDPTAGGAEEPPPPADDDGPDRSATAVLDDPFDASPRPPIHHEPGPDEPPAPARPPGSDPPEDDVLEETPDFLQDTPDHDRLWFEQKPPRDFDLDD